jgi:TatD DNase family protein
VQLFDTHTHLDFEAFNSDRNEVLNQFAALGGRRLLIAGVQVAHFDRIKRVVDELSNRVTVSFSLGLHPMFDHGDMTTALTALDQKLADWQSQVSAIGEFGLDKFSETPLDCQLKLVDQHLELANKYRLPVILHCRGYHNELLQCLDRNPPKCGGVLHAFSGSEQLGLSFVKRGLKLGIGGVISYERAAKTRRAIEALPLDSLVLETDSPDMPLQGYQGQRNEPSQIVHVLNALAELRGCDREALAAILYNTSEQLFS